MHTKGSTINNELTLTLPAKTNTNTAATIATITTATIMAVQFLVYSQTFNEHLLRHVPAATNNLTFHFQLNVL